MSDNEEYLVWMDLEMSGLDVTKENILEIATIITDRDLDIIAEGPVLTISAEEELLEAMDDWNKKHHAESGLLTRVRQSTITVEEAEEQTLAFIKRHVGHRTTPLCGNSVHQDRLFLRAYMPTLEEYLHYRNVDVSSIKELVHRWYPKEYQAPPKKQLHRALDDIKESIEELRYYREQIFV